MNLNHIREQFPTLKQKVHDKELVYLDSAATTLKPQCVIDRLTKYYSDEVSNVHRGIHFLSSQATDYFEDARRTVQNFIGAQSDQEIIFTSGTTESINLIANSFGKKYLNEGDEIIVSTMEHHSNLVPWQEIAKVTGAKIIECPITDSGEIEIERYKELLNKNTKIVSVCHISNTLGTINPISEMISLAHDHDAYFVVDAAQSIAHTQIDVKNLDCDFLVFSGHKAFAPTGIGVLYGKLDLLNTLPPYQTGGGMIEKVEISNSTFLNAPERFEAGTPHIAGAIVLKTALDFITSIGFEAIAEHENDLIQYGNERLNELKDVNIIGTAKSKIAVFSMSVEGVHPHDMGMILDQQGIAVRTGHHCTGPLMNRFNVPATTRASFSLYNNKDDIDALITGIEKALKLFKD